LEVMHFFLDSMPHELAGAVKILGNGPVARATRWPPKKILLVASRWRALGGFKGARSTIWGLRFACRLVLWPFFGPGLWGRVECQGGKVSGARKGKKTQTTRRR